MSDNEVLIYKGDSIVLDFHLVDEEGQDFDLTDYTERKFMVKVNKDDGDGDAVLTKTEVDIAIVDASHGEMELELVHDDTKDVPTGRNYYELQIRDPVGDLTYTPLQNLFIVLEKVVDVS